MKKYIVSLDSGTTSVRAIIYDDKGKLIGKSSKQLKLIVTNEKIEQDPDELYKSALLVIKEVIIKYDINIDDIESLGITNQRETTIIWSKSTGKAIYNAISWQSTQSQDYYLKYLDKTDYIYQKTGLVLNSYFSMSKILYILDNVKDINKDDIMIGTVDTWLLYNFTKGKSFYTDITNASRTLLFNINTLKWDDELLDLFQIKKEWLPTVQSNIYDFGSLSIMGKKIPINAMIGDQQASLLGQSCIQEGQMKITYGTGIFLLYNLGSKPIFVNKSLVTTIGYQIDNKVAYALEGSVLTGGDLLSWLRDNLGFDVTEDTLNKILIDESRLLSPLVIPSLTGLGSPYWNRKVKCMILDVGRDTTSNDLIRSSFTGLCLVIADVVNYTFKSLDNPSIEIHCDGGGTRNKVLLQMQSNIIDKKLYVSNNSEATSFGAYILCALKAGFFKSLVDFDKHQESRLVISPNRKSEELYKELQMRFDRAMKMAINYYEN